MHCISTIDRYSGLLLLHCHYCSSSNLLVKIYSLTVILKQDLYCSLLSLWVLERICWRPLHSLKAKACWMHRDTVNHEIHIYIRGLRGIHLSLFKFTSLYTIKILSWIPIYDHKKRIVYGMVWFMIRCPRKFRVVLPYMSIFLYTLICNVCINYIVASRVEACNMDLPHTQWGIMQFVGALFCSDYFKYPS
jgi:hypothetical protein